jgi:hypothetical protein
VEAVQLLERVARRVAVTGAAPRAARRRAPRRCRATARARAGELARDQTSRAAPRSAARRGKGAHDHGVPVDPVPRCDNWPRFSFGSLLHATAAVTRKPSQAAAAHPETNAKRSRVLGIDALRHTTHGRLANAPFAPMLPVQCDDALMCPRSSAAVPSRLSHARAARLHREGHCAREGAAERVEILPVHFLKTSATAMPPSSRRRGPRRGSALETYLRERQDRCSRRARGSRPRAGFLARERARTRRPEQGSAKSQGRASMPRSDARFDRQAAPETPRSNTR